MAAITIYLRQGQTPDTTIRLYDPTVPDPPPVGTVRLGMLMGVGS